MGAQYPILTAREGDILDGMVKLTTPLEKELWVLNQKLFESNGAAMLWADRWHRCARLLRRAAEKIGASFPDLHDVEREDLKKARETIRRILKEEKVNKKKK